MLQHLFPKSFQRFRSLPLLGSIAEEFAGWLLGQRYREGSLKHQVRTLIRIDGQLRQLGLQRLHELTVERLRTCAPAHSQDDRLLAATLNTLERFLTEQDLLCQPTMTPVSRVNTLTKRYADYLKDLRSLAPSTIRHHLQTAVKLLEHLGYETAPSRLQTLTANDVEQFVRSLSGKYGRGSMQHMVAHLRGFLRFLSTKRLVPLGLDSQIDTPRLYRFEQLPRALDWDTVGAFLQSIDRTSPMGLRDHAMFFLMATYGLRPCEIVALTLEDFHWRAGWFRVPQRKTGTTLQLPLTEASGAVLLQYLRKGRPAWPFRELFLRARAPAGRLKPTAVTEAFQAWCKRSGLAIPFQGPYCLRHSYATHLLNRGASLKAIGDLLGHRSRESTCSYLRLAVEDLREVALSVPDEIPAQDHGEVFS